MDIIILVIFALIGGLVQSATGMGHGMVLMTLPVLFVPYIPLLLSVKILHICFFIPVLFMYKKIKWKILLLPTLISYLGVILGTSILTLANQNQLSIVLGGIMLVLAVNHFINKKNVCFEAKWYHGMLAGLVSGFCSAIASMAGPPLAYYYLSTKELSKDKDAYYATIMTTFFLINLQQLMVLAYNKNIPSETMSIVYISIIPLIIGIFLGRAWTKRVNQQQLKNIVFLVLGITGVYLIINNLIILVGQI